MSGADPLSALERKALDWAKATLDGVGDKAPTNIDKAAAALVVAVLVLAKARGK